MKVTFLGHAGLYVETTAGSILCDPWFNPAYFASWFPFPSNEDLDADAIAAPDYLYISHLHHDHFDPAFLAARVSRATTVLLPDFPLDELRRELTDLGFSRFQVLANGVTVDLDGLGLMAATAAGPSDGPFGDSALAVDDGTARLLDQNDARPRDLDAIRRFGPYDAHFLQFSGAIWYPVVYDMPAEAKAEAGRQKRIRGMDRARLFAEEVGATSLFPCAGPPCFLDDGLFGHNDLDADEANPFPDQTVFLDYLKQQGHTNAHLIVPGTVVTLADGECRVAQPAGSDDQLMAPFRDKRAYLEAYQARQRPAIAAARSSWPGPGQVDIVGELQRWWGPLLAQGDRVCANVGAPVLLAVGDVAVVIDFPGRQVRAHAGEHCPYRFRVEPGVVEACIRERSADWVNGLFLSLRFTAARDGQYNEHIYTFFKCLSEERLRYAESWAAADSAGAHPGAPAPIVRAHRPARDAEEWCLIDGWRVQGRCPHLQGDLSRFGSIEDDVLTCKLHGWQFDLPSGRCLTTGEPDAIKADRV
ncbi:MAG: Rieske 2Fe-2S domain-containing protein [Actinomycetota bacterium]|nr:Rieske 2Fe-2S domain-containing protein [Actinomycetota bacterium]